MPSPRWLIADGTDPTWGPDGTDVYYRSGARLMAEPFLPPQYDDYDIHPDGRTLVMVRPAGSTQGREVTMASTGSRSSAG